MSTTNLKTNKKISVAKPLKIFVGCASAAIISAAASAAILSCSAVPTVTTISITTVNDKKSIETPYEEITFKATTNGSISKTAWKLTLKDGSGLPNYLTWAPSEDNSSIILGTTKIIGYNECTVLVTASNNGAISNAIDILVSASPIKEIPASKLAITDKVCTGFTADVSDLSSFNTLRTPDTVESIEASAFENKFTTDAYKTIKNLVLSSSLANIKKKAFKGCSGLDGKLVLPASLASIGANGFNGCSGFTSLEIPRSLTTIGDSAFGSCSNLTKINTSYEESLPSVATDAFTGAGSNKENGLLTNIAGKTITTNAVFDKFKEGGLPEFWKAAITSVL